MFKIVPRIILIIFVIMMMTGCIAYDSSHLNNGTLPQELSNCVLNKYMFNNEWSWIRSNVAQVKEEPTPENHYNNLLVMSDLAGEYGAGQDYVELTSSLKTYFYPIDWEVPPILPDQNSHNTISIFPSFYALGNKMIYDCNVDTSKSKYASFSCVLTGIYTKEIVKVYIYGPAHMSESEIGEIINPALIKINACVLSLEK